MVSRAWVSPLGEARSGRYRQAERRVWDHYGLEPAERFIDLGGSVRLRVLDVGPSTGKPVLFVHGTIGLGVWPVLMHRLPGIRCLILERPGWGLSSSIDFSGRAYRTLTADLLAGALDALDLERASVVGGSIGNIWALALAAAHPSRVDRVVLIGGSPVVAQVGPPRIIRLIASPIGALLVRLPPRRRMELAQLRQNGHGASVADGRIPDAILAWRLALGRETDSMRHERDMVRSILRRDGWRPGLTFEDHELAAIDQPALYVWGTFDPVGTPQIWEHVVSQLPQGELLTVEGAGHTPWLDEPDSVAGRLSRFLNG